MNDLTRAWAEYLDALAVEAPVTRAALLPAGELDIDSAQQELGLPLLPDLVTWFGLHGGSGYSFDCAILPFCMALVDLAQSVRFRWPLMTARQAGWDQIARGGPWPHGDVVVSASLSPAQWTFVLASLESGIDGADLDEAEEAEELRGVLDLVSAQIHTAG